MRRGPSSLLTSDLSTPEPPEKEANHGDGQCESGYDAQQQSDECAESSLDAVPQLTLLEKLPRRGSEDWTEQEAEGAEEEADYPADHGSRDRSTAPAELLRANRSGEVVEELREDSQAG